MTDPSARARECAEKILPYFDFTRAPLSVHIRSEGIAFLAALVEPFLDAERADEREACAGVCRAEAKKWTDNATAHLGRGRRDEAIRCERCSCVASDCEDAIRARGEG